ncbi:MAG: YqzL family protein [Clostridia bacterium]|nr:YqzL family protein [Clostridia bacterium]
MKEEQMKDMAWNTFKKTGNVDTFLELVKLQNALTNQPNNEPKNIEETK